MATSKWTVTYSRHGNKFFFITNLSQWHFSCQNEYNRQWIKETGPLTKQERIVLQKLRPLLRKYGFNRSTCGKYYLGYYFFTILERRSWATLQQHLLHREFLLVRDTFRIFEPRFSLLWHKEGPRLQRAQETLQKILVEKRYVPLINDLQKLFGRDLRKIRLQIILLMRPSGLPWHIGGGSANLGSNRLTLEAGDVTPRTTRRLRKMLMIFFHEAIHTSLSHPHFERTLRSFLRPHILQTMKETPLYKAVRSAYTILNEGITSAFLPQGLLADHYFGGRSDLAFHRRFPKGEPNIAQQRSLSDWRIFAAYQLKPIVESYWQKHRRLDIQFIESAYRIFLHFTKTKGGD